MHSAKTLLTAILLCCALSAADFSGKSALEFTRAVVELGPRPPGSKAHRATQDYIRKQLSQWECEVSDDSFTADTPVGPVKMSNIIARFPGASGRAVVVSGHYDTKYMKDVRFVGANDAGSSTGLLLEMARVLSGAKRIHDVYVVFFDGEEAFGNWSSTDGVYGSRHLASRWNRDGTLRKVDALINVDMVGDRHLVILDEQYSTRSLMGLVHQSAAELGYEQHFPRRRGAIEDDHVPFLRLGVNAVDLIDFDYGEGNEYWHTDEDTLDKLDPKSLEVVGRVVLRVIEKLEKK